MNKVGTFQVAVGAVIANEETGKVLLVKRADALDWHAGEWEFVYGRMDQHERPEEALRREVQEETGIEGLEIGDVLRIWHIYRGEENTAKNELVGITYVAKTVQETVKLSSEHSEYKWADPTEAIGMIKVEGIKADAIYFSMKYASKMCCGATGSCKCK